MAISIRQYQKIYNKHLLAILKDGKIPSFEEVILRAGDELPSPEETSTPIYKYIPQPSSSVFDINLYNKSIQRISTDLNVLFEELTEIEVNNIQRILHANLFHNVHSYELAKLSKQLDALLFALQGADDNFFAAYDNFKDLSKTNTTESTPGVVALDEGCLSLPIATKGTLKIDLSHLYNVTASNIKITPSDIKSLGNIPGTTFGNIFRDSNNAWGIILESTVDQKVEVSFTFALQAEEFINRITLQHHGIKPQNAFVSTSVDGFNIKAISEYSDGLLLNNQSETKSLDFSDTLTEYIHITLSKDKADSIESSNGINKYQYIFGLKNISVFITGRGESATYQSKPFDFSTDTSNIGSVAIASDEKIPDGTSIDWQVGLVDNTGKQVGVFMPISPQSRSLDQGLPKVINVRDIVRNSKYIISNPASDINVFTFNSTRYYSITTLDSKPLFGGMTLLRGQRAWSRDSTGNLETTLVKDNFVPFSKGTTQTLYSLKQEVTTVKSVATSTTKRVALVTSPPLYTDNGSYSLIPTRDINTDKDISPAYAIYNVSLVSGAIAKTKSVTFVGGETNLGQPNIIYTKKGDVTVREVVVTPFGNYTAGQVVQDFVDGKDFIVELNSNNTPTGKIILTTGSTLSSSPVLAPNTEYIVGYTVDPDITRFVTSIINNQIFFDVAATNPNVITNEQIIVKYRFVPTNILKSSIKVKAFYGVAGDSKVYRQGVDYTFDTLTSTIQRLTTGDISSDKDVYVDYKYNSNTSQVHQFYIWAYVSIVDGLDIKVKTLGSGSLDNQNTLQPDTTLGESISANVPGLGLIELTNAVEWPTLKGWIQFVVKAIPPESLVGTNKQSLINQVISIKDRQGDYIFVKGGKYFSELTAIREPLRQVSLPFLKTNVLKNDRNNFAINEVLGAGIVTYQVVVNFRPNSTDELYCFSIDPLTGTIVQNYEEWKLDWTSNESDIAYTKVIVRALLGRSKTVNGNVTPKVFNYYIKVGL